jgi:monoamine oxidase
MSSDPTVIIIGAGVAGLSAAVKLIHTGMQVLILEARDRLGGRIFTRHDPATKAVVELGAEFVHGRPPEIWELLRRRNVQAQEVVGEDWCVREKQLCTCDFFSEIDEILEKMDDRGPDRSFRKFLDSCCPDPKQQESKKWAQGYITGFHAADPNLISVHSLVKGLRADEEIDADQTFRIHGGYERLVEWFRRELSDAGVSIHLRATAESVSWKQGSVEVKGRNAKGPFSYTTSQVLITLPLAVLQASPDQKGAIRFSPELPAEKRHALGQLAMGRVIRVTLCFRERFWDNLQPPRSSEPGTLSELRFVFSQDEWFPTWWTTMPEKLPIITGWAPSACADRLSGHPEDFVAQRAIEALSRLLGIRQDEIQGLSQAVYCHDWQNDPLSRGAYSYVKVGGDAAQQQLAAPVENTLFFAGEATDFSGHHGTVHGAIASGYRAAAEILNQRKT